MRVWLLGMVSALLLAALGTVALPRGISAVRFLAGPRDEPAAAAYLLTRKTADDYTDAAERALADNDEDLAASIAQLAAERGVSLPASLATRVAAARDAASARMGSDAW